MEEKVATSVQSFLGLSTNLRARRPQPVFLSSEAKRTSHGHFYRRLSSPRSLDPNVFCKRTGHDHSAERMLYGRVQ